MADGKELQAIISLVGQMDPSLRKVAADAQKEFDDLKKKANASSKSVADGGQKAYQKFGKIATNALKKVGKVTLDVTKKAAKATAVGTVAAATGIATLAGLSLKNYAEYEQLVGGVDTLFKGSSKLVQGYANDAYKTAGLSANAYMETITSFSASLLQSLGGDTERAAQMGDQAVIDMADNANKMGTDISSIQQAYQSLARGQYGMLDNLKLGYGGTKGEMERLIKDANALRVANGQAGDLTIDKFADVVQAIHEVQTQMGITGTTAKEASETISGSVNAAKAAWQNWLTGLANEDADLGKLTDQLLDSVATVGKNVLPRAEVILERLTDFVGEKGPEIIEQLVTGVTDTATKLIPAGGKALLSLAQGIVQAAPRLIMTAGQLLLYLANGIVANIPTIITLGMQLIAAFAQACVAYLPQLIPVGVQAIISLVTGLASNLPTIVSYAGQILVALIQGILASLPLLVEQGPQILQSLVEGIIGAAGKILELGWQIVQMLGSAILDGLANIGGMIWDGLCSIFTGQPVEVPAEVSDVDTTAVANTELPTLEVPEVEVPELPTIEMPEVDTSSLDALQDIDMPTIDTSSLQSATADYTSLVQGAEQAKQQITQTFATVGTDVTNAINTGLAGAGTSFTPFVTAAQTSATQVSAAYQGVGTGIGAGLQAALSGSMALFTSFQATGTTSAHAVQASHMGAANVVRSAWMASLTQVGSRALQTVASFTRMALAGTNAGSSIRSSMSGVSSTISNIVSSAYSATSALNQMASAAARAQSAAASASSAGRSAQLARFAAGGFTAGPSLAGEDPRYPTEAVISFNPAYRAANRGYVLAAAQKLGMDATGPWTKGAAAIESGSIYSTGGPGDTVVEVGGITFAPNITIQGSASKDDIVAALRKVEPEFVDFVRQALEDSEVGDYAYGI